MMGNKLVIVPFDLELSKEITNGEAEGRIITRVGNSVRILCYDVIGNKYKICGLINSEGSEEPEVFTEKGLLYEGHTDDLDLMLEIPEYLSFKDGDVITFGNKKDSLSTGIFRKRDSKTSHTCYVILSDLGNLSFHDKGRTYNNARLATEEEKQKLIDALISSKHPEAKEYCKTFFGIGKKKGYEFKPFDKVLVRQSETCKWEASFFSNITEEVHKYRCCGMNYMFCIPYDEQTAHLLGTKDNWEE